MDALCRLVSDPEALHVAWEREPLLSSGLGDFDDIFSLAEAERLIFSGLPNTSVRVVSGGRPLPAAQFAKKRERRGRGSPAVADGYKVVQAMSAGATLVVEELQTFSPTVGDFAAAVAEASGYHTYCAAFLTPRGRQGMTLHYDTVSVFMRQLSGSKRWRICPPATRWPVREWDGKPLPDEPLLDITLRPGDCLYVPRGFGHVGEATDQASVHLTVGLRPTTWASFLLARLTEAAESVEALREALPPGFAPADHAALFHERRDALAAQLAALVPGRAGPARSGAAGPYHRNRAGLLSAALNGEGVCLDGGQ